MTGERQGQMSEHDELDQDIASDLLKLAEAIRRQRIYLTVDNLHVDVDNDLAEAIRRLEQAAGKLVSTE